MSSEQGDTQNGIISMITNPSTCTANWFIGLSIWGIFLAFLNIFGYAHPSFHYSWGGLFTLELTNVAYEQKDGLVFPLFVPSDAVFIAICSLFLYFGSKAYAETEDGIGGFFKGLFVNDTWPALAAIGEGGIQRTLAAWSTLIGFGVYAYFGIKPGVLGWMDPGVYAVSIAFIAFGLALNHASRAPEGEDNLD
mgnify:CR=1 FL=1